MGIFMSDYSDLYDSISNMDENTGTGAVKNISSVPAARGRKRSKKKKEDDFWTEVLSYIKIILLAVIIAVLSNTFVIVNAQVPTGSMKTTIMEGDRLIGFRLSYLFSEPERGDIIIFKNPDNEQEIFVKRVIGTPGDVVEIMKDDNNVVHVYVNGEMIDEPYIMEPMNTNVEYLSYVVPKDSYFAMGDNRNNSLDSRYWEHKFISRDKILAKAVFKYYKNFELLE